MFRERADFLNSDVVFGVKEALITPFTRRPAGRTPAGTDSPEPFLVAEYDFVLQPASA